MKGRLGDTDYFIISMKAQELVEKAKILNPKEWDDMSLEERYQREIDLKRVKTQIAPYLARESSRFFGAIIVAAMNFSEESSFEPLSEMLSKGVPGLYREEASKMGFLILGGGEVLVPLDGQHRIKAIEFAVTGRDQNGDPIPAIEPCTDLAQEDVTVILVPFEREKARRIFTRVNLYAKKPSTGQNIVTNDDDIVAILAREITNDLIDAGLVKFSGNTLNKNDIHFTTLSTVYNCSDEIIKGNFPGGKIDKTQLPSAEAAELYRRKVQEVWSQVLDGIEVFRDALSDRSDDGNDERIRIRESSLLGKPVAQECLVRAFVRLTNPPPSRPSTKFAAEDACKNLNRLPWAITEENLKVWDRVLWTGGTDGKILTKNRNLTTDLIAYLAGEELSDEEKSTLLENYLTLFPEAERENKQLPKMSVD